MYWNSVWQKQSDTIWKPEWFGFRSEKNNLNDKKFLSLGYSPTLAAVNDDQHKFYNAVDFHMETMETDMQVFPHKKFKNINLINKQLIQ